MSFDSEADNLSPTGASFAPDIVHTAQVKATDTAPMVHLAYALGPGPFSLITLFVTPSAEFAEVVEAATRAFPDTDIVACTTAGEIGEAGYEEDLIVAIGFPASGFATTSILLEDIDSQDAQQVIDRITLARLDLRDRPLAMDNNFAFLMVDGLSLSEDTLAATIAPALRDFPVFGGSAGDGTTFRQTFVALNGQVATNAAVLTLARCKYRSHVFSLNHLIPGERQMVVTEADPAKRIVKMINAEPAAQEYARIVGKDPYQLDRFTFASHPVVVRIGDAHHVRAIQQVNEDGELVFFSAIDEGMVLTVASPDNMAKHLRRELSELGADETPANIISCDCILRRIEAEQSQMTRELSDLMSANRITGFSTYGEQIGPLHVNQTMTGVAFYHAQSETDETSRCH